MNIGLVDVDGGKFPNLALMKIARWHRSKGDNAMIGASINESYERLTHFRERRKVRVVAQPFRDPVTPNDIPQWQKDMARWAMRREFYTTCDFKDFEPRKGFKCKKYFNE